MKLKYHRILLKLSGEALMKSAEVRLDAERLSQYATEIKKTHEMGVQVAIVIGGGNIFRGMNADNIGVGRVAGDYMGMLATVINGIGLQSAIEQLGLQTRLMSGINMEPIAESYIMRRAVRHLEKGHIVIFASGTGNPYFTTDTAASLRSVEINADIILKGTRVNGVYSEDPEKNPKAIRYDKLTYEQAFQKGLKVMDKTAYSLCQENKLPIMVFNMNKPGNLLKIINGNQTIGTIIN